MKPMKLAIFILALTSGLEAQELRGWIPTKLISCDYPILAIQARISGAVHLRVTLGKDGGVREVTPVAGNRILLSAARKSLETWVFEYLPSSCLPETELRAKSFDFTMVFTLVSEASLTVQKFVYQFPNRATVTAIAPYRQP